MAKINCTLSKKQLTHIVGMAKAFRPDPVIMRFNKDGLRMSLLDPSESCMMVYHVLETKFEFYDVQPSEGKDEIELCLGADKLAEAVKVMTKESVQLSYDGVAPKLSMKSGRTTRTVPTYYPEKAYRKDIPQPKLTSSFKLPANDALDTFEKTKTVSEFIAIFLMGGKLTIHAGDTLGEIETNFDPDETQHNSVDAKSLYTVGFMLDMLCGVTGKEDVHFQFGDAMPMFVSYSNDTGDYMAIAAPRIETE